MNHPATRHAFPGAGLAFCATFLLVLFPPAAATAQEGPGKEGPAPFATTVELTYEANDAVPAQGGGCHRLAERPAALTKTPEGDLAFFALKLGGATGQNVTIAYDPENKTLVADCNGNNDLTDDMFLDFTSQGGVASPLLPKEGGTAYRFPPIELSIPAAGGTVKYRFKCTPTHLNTTGELFPFMELHPSCWMRGKFSLKGRKVQVALVDGNVNGRYDEFPVSKASFTYADRILLDVDGDGVIACDKLTTYLGYEGFDSNFVWMDNTLLEFTIAPDGRSAAIKEVPTETGSVRGPDGDWTLSVTSSKGLWHIRGVDGVARVPAGKYGKQRYVLSRKDREGAAWSIVGMWPAAALGKGPTFTVSAGKKKTVKFGPPLKASLQTQLQDGSIEITLTMAGSGGEQVPGVYREADRVDSQNYSVLGPDGAPVGKGTMTYG
ncbi:MAG: hypothetical protein RDV41_05265 [Planctomycetota bacterium]|nr:hypothetical protein [Planctomycetota bacterium]